MTAVVTFLIPEREQLREEGFLLTRDSGDAVCHDREGMRMACGMASRM